MKSERYYVPLVCEQIVGGPEDREALHVFPELDTALECASINGQTHIGLMEKNKTNDKWEIFFIAPVEEWER